MFYILCSICAGKLDSHQCQAGVVINQTPTEDQVSNNALTTGGAYGFEGATTSLTNELMPSSKRVTLIRHGLSAWNEQSRVQVCSSFLCEHKYTLYFSLFP